VFNTEQARAYLAAMIDGEGWIGEPKSVQNRAIRIANTDPVLIDAIRECCAVLGLHYTMTSHAARHAHWKPQQQVHITGRPAMAVVLATVPIRSPKKLDRLARTVESYRQPLPLDEATVRDLYAQGLTVREVAREMGVGTKRVIYAMRTYDITRRHGADRAESVWRSRRKVHGPTGRRPGGQERVNSI
jgi:LAGLIDADG-like domain